jgi:hypothetical protein
MMGLISRIELSRECIKLVTRAPEFENLLTWDFVGHFQRRAEDSGRWSTYIINVPCAGSVMLERRVRLPIAARDPRATRNTKGLRKLVADAREAWALVESNRDLSPAEIARNRSSSVSHFMRLLRLNYLAPDIVIALLDGTQPKELTRRQVLDSNLPLDWALQRQLFGFPEQPPMRTCERS